MGRPLKKRSHFGEEVSALGKISHVVAASDRPGRWKERVQALLSKTISEMANAPEGSARVSLRAKTTRNK